MKDESHGIGHCRKEPHTGSGYLHAEDDDAPYIVDGVKYCGRCHLVLARSESPQ